MLKWVVAPLFLAFGLFFTFAIVWSGYRQNDAHQRFRPVSATVVKSRVATSTSGSGAQRTRSYRPDITYAYEVEGRAYQSKKFQFLGSGHSSYDSADQVVERYPVGGSITAYYDPADPSIAVLDNSPVDMIWLYAGACGFWSVVLGLLGFFIWRA